MIYINFTFEAVRHYYNCDFSRDLMRYFTIELPLP